MKGKFSSTEVLELLDCVNNLRSSVKPPAKNLPQISWSNDLAHKAAEVAEASCKGEIDSVEEIIGMGLNANIAFSKMRPRSVCSAVSFWASGKKIYKVNLIFLLWRDKLRFFSLRKIKRALFAKRNRRKSLLRKSPLGNNNSKTLAKTTPGSFL